MAYLVFVKIFPIVPLKSGSHHDEPLGVALTESRASHIRRLVIFGLTLLVGISVAVTGFLLSARIGTKHYLDPIVPMSPVIFITGVMTSFISAIVYEIVPAMKPRS